MKRAAERAFLGSSAPPACFALIAALLLAALAPAGAPAAEPTPTDVRSRLERALADYDLAQGEAEHDARIAAFRRAERGFAALIGEGLATAALYTNLGNAALQAGDPGQAVLAYRRALALDPDAQAARQNLGHLRSRLPDWVPRPSERGRASALFVDRRIPASLRSVLAAGCFALAALGGVVASRRGGGIGRAVAIGSGLAWLGLVASVAFEEAGGNGEAAVLVAEETPARASDSALAPLAFPEPLPPGVEVERLEVRGDFARVRLANDRDVWVRHSSVALVAD